jgi:hypothetical protein
MRTTLEGRPEFDDKSGSITPAQQLRVKIYRLNNTEPLTIMVKITDIFLIRNILLIHTMFPMIQKPP